MHGKKIVIFEDIAWFHFYPLTLTRPVCDLVSGIYTLYEKIALRYPECEISILCRPEMEKLVLESGRSVFRDEDFARSEEYVFINARAGFAERHRFETDTCCFDGDSLVYVHPGPGCASDWKVRDFIDGEAVQRTRALGLPEKKPEHRLHASLWDLIDHCPSEILRDIATAGCEGRADTVGDGVVRLGDGPLILGEGARIDPGAVIDTSGGPVVIGAGARIRPLSFLEGPVAIGAEALIDMAHVRGGCRIGRGCRIGGELEASIIHDFTNKHHDGFLGHAYLGSWVNIGAGATNSDLRNDYREIRIQMEGRAVLTGRIKAGCLVGDHVKIGIGTLLNTGVVIGPCASVYNEGPIIVKEVPPCVVGGKLPFRELPIERILETAATVMQRRGRALGEAERERLLLLFAETRDARSPFLREALD